MGQRRRPLQGAVTVGLSNGLKKRPEEAITWSSMGSWSEDFKPRKVLVFRGFAGGSRKCVAFFQEVWYGLQNTPRSSSSFEMLSFLWY